MVLMDGTICHYRWETEAYPEEYLDGIKSLKQMGEEGDSIIKPKGKNYFLLKKPGEERYLYIISEPAVDDSIRKLYY